MEGFYMLNVKKIESSIPSHFGHVQREIIEDLIQHGQTSKLCLYMKSQKRYSSYCQSIANAIDWLTAQGVKIQYVPGRRGGAWTAHYKLD